MSDDLISRKETERVLKECISDISHTQRGYESENEILKEVGILKAISCIINPQIVPTAYDVDKVVKTINEIGKRYCNSIKCEKNCEDCEHGCLMRAIINAVKSGGVTND